MNEEIKLPQDIKDEIAHFKETKIPRCMICKKSFINGIDPITKKKSKYLWEPTCKCTTVRIMIG